MVLKSLNRNVRALLFFQKGESRVVIKWRSSFGSQVSASELMYLREKEGLTNAEIAKRCGVSHKLVLDLIGKQPSRAKDQQRKE